MNDIQVKRRGMRRNKGKRRSRSVKVYKMEKKKKDGEGESLRAIRHLSQRQASQGKASRVEGKRHPGDISSLTYTYTIVGREVEEQT